MRVSITDMVGADFGERHAEEMRDRRVVFEIRAALA
jgi:hypothetical protein